MRVLITGAAGFIGSNLVAHLEQRGDCEVMRHTRTSSAADLEAAVARADLIYHLAGANRPADPADFTRVNVCLTADLCATVRAAGRAVPIVYSSSVHAELDNPYGRSKREAEEVLLEHMRADYPVHILRLPHVFGKWSRPEYNSAVATFCHNTARGLPVRVSDPSYPLRLLYVDDLVETLVRPLNGESLASPFAEAAPVYEATLQEVADLIRAFHEKRQDLCVENVGAGLPRALYATYLSFLEPHEFAYRVPAHADARGVFVEMVKTPEAGQISFFSAHPGVTRGGHYHHTKTEKFLVVHGDARFRFRHTRTGEQYELLVSGTEPQVVDAVPGWSHDITNVGTSELMVLLWANERFDPDRPDTYRSEL